MSATLKNGQHKNGAPNAAPAAANSGRDSHGRFAPGNRLGKGNPFARRVAALRRAFLSAVRPEDLRAIARGLIERAKAGDNAAAKLLLAYALGKPTEAVDPDGLDEGVWRRRAAAPTGSEVQEVLNYRIPFHIAVPFAAGMDYALREEALRALADPAENAAAAAKGRPAGQGGAKPGKISPRTIGVDRLTSVLKGRKRS